MDNLIKTKRFEEGVKIFFIVFALVVTIGLYIDIILKHNLSKLIDNINYLEIFINLFVLLAYFMKRIDVRFAYGIIVYLWIFNSLLSSSLNIFHNSGLDVFMRDSIFLIIIILFSTFILGKVHTIIQSIVYLIYLFTYTFISNQPFLINNSLLFAIIYIVLGLMLYFLKTVFNSKTKETEQLLSLLSKRNEDIENQNRLLKEHSFELTTLNEALVSKKEELDQQKNDLQRANTTKDKLLSIIAHDLKDLVASIYGSSRYLEEKFIDLDEIKKFQFVGIINESSRKLSDLLDNMLQWSRSQTNKITFTKDKLKLQRIVNKVIDHNQIRLDAKEISFKNEIPKDLISDGDEQLLFIILHNLISNAIKFTPVGGNIEVRVMDNNDNQVVEVIDDGIGMDTEKYYKIFGNEPFENQMGTSGEIGTGLGLTLCKEFVEMHEGSIGAKPNTGKGSTFWFLLPKYIIKQPL